MPGLGINFVIIIHQCRVDWQMNAANYFKDQRRPSEVVIQLSCFVEHPVSSVQFNRSFYKPFILPCTEF